MPLFGPPNIDKLERKQDLDGLIKALDYTRDPAIPIAAAQALGRICPPGETFAVRRLANQIHSKDPDLRRAALLSAGQIGSSEAAGDVVMTFQRETDPRVWEAAAWALAQIDNDRTLKALEECFTADQPDRHQAVVQALDTLGWQPGQNRLSAWYWLTRGDLDALEALGPLALPPLINRLHSQNNAVSAHAADILALLGAPAVEALIRALSDPDPFVRQQAARALGEIGDARAVKPLLLALSDRAQVVRTAAVAALLKGDDPDILAKIAEGMIRDAALWEAGQAHLDRLQTHLIRQALIRLSHPAEAKQDAGRQALVRLGAAAVLSLIEALETKNAHEMAGAAKALMQINDPRAVPGLIHALEEGEITNKHSLPLIDALGKLGDARAVPALARFLRASLPSVQRAAVTALGEIGAPEGAPPLVDCMSQLPGESKMHAAVLDALGRIGAAEAIPAVLPWLQASRADIRQQAAQALDQMGWTPGAEADVEAPVTPAEPSGDEKRLNGVTADTESRTQAAVLELIRTLETKQITNEGAIPVIEALSELGDTRAVPGLTRFLESSLPAVQRAAVQALGRIGAPRAAAPLIAFLSKMPGESKMHLTVLRALGQIGAAEAIPAVKPYLQARRADIRQEAARVLDALGWTTPSAEADPPSTARAIEDLAVTARRKQAIDFLKAQGAEAVPELIDAAESSFQELEVREICFRILGETGDPRAVEALGICFTTNRQYPLRRAALEALSRLDNPSVTSWLTKDFDAVMNTGGKDLLISMGKKAVDILGIYLTTDTHYRHRLAACEMLVTVGDPSAGPWLAECLEKETSKQVKMAVLQAAGELNTAEALKPLRVWLEEKPDYTMRIQICKVLGKINHPDSGKLLVYCLENDSSQNVRLAAAHAIGALGWVEAVPAILNVLSEKHPQTALEAITAIGKDAVQPLTEMLSTWSPAAFKIADTALKNLGWQPKKDALGALYWTRMRDYEQCAAIGKPALDVLLKVLTGKIPYVGVSIGLIEALDKIGDPLILEPLMTLIDDGKKWRIFHKSLETVLTNLGAPAVAAMAGGCTKNM
jgi:HEAT repeat protein